MSLRISFDLILTKLTVQIVELKPDNHDHQGLKSTPANTPNGVKIHCNVVKLLGSLATDELSSKYHCICMKQAAVLYSHKHYVVMSGR